MVDPTQPNPFRARAFGPADHGLMIPVSHVVLLLAVLLLLSPIALMVQGSVLSVWTPGVPSHGTIVTEVLISLLLIFAFFLMGMSRHYNWERFGFWIPVRTDYLFVGGILAISIFIQPLFMFGFDTDGASDLRQDFFAAYHPQGVLIFELLVFAALVILMPLFEEMVFRGLFFGWARQRLGFISAAIFSSLVFAAFHAQYVDALGMHWGFRALGMIFTLGFLSALLFEHTGSLIAPTLLHGLFNLQAAIPLLLDIPPA